jgi:hypothetical protein
MNLNEGTTARAVAAAILAIVCYLLVGVSSADASTYSVRQCWSQGGHGVGQGLFTKNGTNFQGQNYCGIAGNPWAYVRSAGGNAGGQSGTWGWTAPAGTYFDEVSLEYGIDVQSGYGGFMLRTPIGGTPTYWEARAGGSNQLSTSSDSTAVSAVFYCAAPSGCPSNVGGPYTRIRDVRMSVVDSSAPTAPAVGGSIFEGGWKKGTESIGTSSADIGAGLDRLTIEINGQTSTLKDFCSPAVVVGWIASLSPCPATGGYINTISTTSGGFEDGANTVEICASEYGNGAAVRCTTRTVNVDNNAPSKPTELTVAQGSDWQQSDSFDLSWTNPGGQAATIDGAYLRVRGPGGYDSGQVFQGGANRTSASVTVPEPGEYTVDISLRDAAGNVDHAKKATATLQFDDVPPEESAPEIANGWLGKAELDAGYLQEWEPPLEPLPVSGIKGYAFVADQSQGTDPCDVAGAGGAAVDCSAGEVNHGGIDNRSTTLDEDELEEGNNWVHVVPVSGAGVKADEIEETRLQVDTVNPTTAIEGLPSGWSRSAVRLTARGADSRSGMVDNDSYPHDDPPATFLQIDGSAGNEPDAAISRTIGADGNHAVTYWARDLAGNAAAKKSVWVKVDRTAPVAYLEQPNPQDPERIVARVSDPTSGLATAKLQVREGSGSWVDLRSKLAAGRVSAAMDSSKMSDGVSYRLRIVATDVAGNTVRATTYANGGEAVQVGPFRDGSRVTNVTLNGKRRGSKLPYGKRAELAGRLVDEDGIPLGGAAVAIIEDFDAGSKYGAVRSKVKTSSTGAFAKTLRKGPGRVVSVRFAGDKTLLGSRSPRSLRLKMGGKIKLSVSRKRVGAGKRTTFEGRIGRRGAKIPKAGKLVEVQVKVGGRWKAVSKATRTDRRGRYSLRYRFGNFYTEPTRFSFRARMLKEAGFPYRAARSRTRAVTIVP